MTRRNGSSGTTGIAQGTGEDLMRSLSRTFSGKSHASQHQDDRIWEDAEVSGEDNESTATKVEEWKLASLVKDMPLNDQAEGRKLGVTWSDLTVKVVPLDASLQENVLSQFNIPQQIKEGRHKPGLRTILDKSSGCVKPGEMLLVLGRPGSGCTTLLKLLANKRKGYSEIEGDVHWGTLDTKEASQYRGSIVINNEEEVFFPTLTVGKTMDFATRLNTPHTLPKDFNTTEDFRLKFKSFLMDSMGISHTEDTKVGDAYVRGVSGGERKRVSIIETIANRGSVVCWDNSTRGLDASTALEWTKAIRCLTDELGLATIVTLYQAGNGIYDLFDKVLILDEGKQVYYGPREEARPFMESQGFICGEGANVADYLTGVTVPSERQIHPDFESRFPRNAGELELAYRQSNIKATMDQELDYFTTEEAKINTHNFREAIKLDKSPRLSKSSAMTVSFVDQVKACVIRQYQILWGDKATFIIKQGSTIIQALIAGSLFYNAPANSSGLFVKGGSLFLGLLYNSLMAMSEVTDSFSGRPVLAKHKNFAFYNPAAFCIAQIAADIPILFFQVTSFLVILYWMTALKATAAAFFTCWFVVYLTTFVMTAFFRMLGAAFPTFDAASKVSGFSLTALILYNGYQVVKPAMHPWFVWIYWINPLSYGFEAVMANEFKNQDIPCANYNLIPNFLPQYLDPAHQSCAGVGGAVPGATSVRGEDYLASLSYSPSNIWRNVGILFAWWVLFVGLTIFFTLRWDDTAGSSGTLLIPRETAKKAPAHISSPSDEEAQIDEKAPRPTAGTDDKEGNSGNASDGALMRNTSVFTWRNLTYTVKTPSGDRTLLDNVHGYVKPGMLGALMGSSGAGKTTLLDVLAQRKTEGTIHGEILVDGRPLPVSFQRSAGYCEQLDVHEPFSTVREALEFSALLRQNRDTPDAEKLAYVDTIIDLLELHDLEHTLIGRVGAGLSVEQRKRVTIGVELVSKPSILIFLDEPTSGLDGQAAYNTVRFLRKLADVGQSVLVTIHQPSAQLFAQFDTLLLLAKGGKTVYFGDIGDDAKTIKEYFGRYGMPCPTGANPAEHMIDVVSGIKSTRDWNKIWLESPEAAKMHADLEHIITDAANKEPGTKDDGHEFSTTLWTQTRIVTRRANISLYRNTDYVNNKVLLHVGVGLFVGFSFWKIGRSVADQQLILFSIFNYIFVAPGVMAQLQPLFIERRDIYEARERKSKMYHWSPFVSALIVSEIPYLIICSILYFLCFYYSAGLPTDSDKAGAFFFVMLVYQFIYTGIGQFVAAYAPNAVFASLVNPLIIGTLVSFCGVLVPYSQITEFWRYWLYYLNPFTYLMGSLLVFSDFHWDVTCKETEFARFDPPSNQTCGEYLGVWLQGPGMGNNLINPAATSDCMVCQYTTGADYLSTVNLGKNMYGWRDAGICVIYALSGYALVYLLMKLRTKASKKAE
ncbi:ABC multidrug transporter-like protein [Bimuria novae-zelandiae CBS 107.79]|uniref:ABC multidrug transporter-like protein n=1 Tax=Bimuria novae-zelandiae CBS 107.79 TaxID=1447943 RepID=A0A6A5UWV2_9PLEO|nr:ABC multidrug transporter-like protein [Bimuria novae-zelandiae CBS 107.79]